MSTLENLLENPDEWEVPIQEVRESRSYKSKIQVKQPIQIEQNSAPNDTAL